MRQVENRVYQVVNTLEKESRFSMEKNYQQHGTTTLFEHSVNVAYMSCLIAVKLNMEVDYFSLLRGALLHDYFLYDWHEKDAGHRLHGFRHPQTALKNAREDFQLTEIEENIISRHMFPVTPIPPTTLEAWIVCCADKVCAFLEMTEPFLIQIRKEKNQHIFKRIYKKMGMFF